MIDTGAMRAVQELSAQLHDSPERASQLLDAFEAAHRFPITDDHTAVFWFRGSPDVRSVHLLHWVFGLETRQPFLRLADTNAWYLPVELPHAARVEYKLDVQQGEHRRLLRDPANPMQAFDPFGSNSVCAMPGYSEPGWTHPEAEARAGRTVSFKVRSKVYGGDRETTVYLPHEFKPHKTYPLLICHDGRDYLRFTRIITVLDNLIARHEVAPLLVAFTSGHDRNREYGADPRQPAFVVDELLPALRSRYRVSDNRDDIGLMGASFGGVTSLYTAWTRPGVFGKLLLQSGSFVFTDVGHHGRSELFDPVVDFVNDFRADPARIGAKVFLSCGTFESLIWFNRSLHPLLADAGIDVRFVEAQDGHNWIAWRDRLRDGLSWLYSGRLWMYYE